MSSDLLFLDPTDLVGKLFCTFASKSELEDTLADIQQKYTIMYNKIFILESLDSDEFICTYNIDPTNLSDNAIIANTILCHRVKANNVLYTLNALNTLIKSLNGGKVDHSYTVNWVDYRNSILLTRGGEFVQVKTKIKDILVLS